MVFFLEEMTHGDGKHQRLTMSRPHGTFVVPPSPSLSSILIALLLSDKSMMCKSTGTVSVNDEPPQSVQPTSPDTGTSRTAEPSPFPEIASSKQRKRKGPETTVAEPYRSTTGETATIVPEIFNHGDVSVPWRRRGIPFVCW